MIYAPLLYLQTSVHDGQDTRSSKWLKQRNQEVNFKSSKWLEVREMLVEKFHKSFSYLQYREKMMRCKQRNGEYMHLYIERFLDLVTKTKLTDNPTLVSIFFHSLLDPVRECVTKKLGTMKREDGTSPAGYYVLEEETLAQLQRIFEKEKTFFDDELDKLFPLIKRNEGSKSPHKVLDNRTPRTSDRKRKHADSDRTTTQDKRPRHDGQRTHAVIVGTHISPGI
ncbi:uncharacterized protein RHIMIDRAFT_316878 [Rhizopus microsporus ATCC 52813]|uniref:Retrotransposon gag domain-containing protein n=1 Tax=Rhizopus microsporus ATCC 52813 TaxID=1340429 RepID=A0A2G4SEQ8_RHIZD|nr:uncharacterized protein RHIMIDRAFT_316878 [Rhizopus microsporus ATCC 52813]PHZ07269.1 hypothetical protein RHIMIDRAFT_316878 [Rhizopus microsporus ATCC 52813]